MWHASTRPVTRIGVGLQDNYNYAWNLGHAKSILGYVIYGKPPREIIKTFPKIQGENEEIKAKPLSLRKQEKKEKGNNQRKD